MATYVFEVRERAVGPHQHSWVAIEKSTDAEIALPVGGNTVQGQSFVGRYPEIQDFLREKYGLNLPITVIGHLDKPITHPDGRTTWIYHRGEAEVIVHDIPRTVARLILTG